MAEGYPTGVEILDECMQAFIQVVDQIEGLIVYKNDVLSLFEDLTRHTAVYSLCYLGR